MSTDEKKYALISVEPAHELAKEPTEESAQEPMQAPAHEPTKEPMHEPAHEPTKETFSELKEIPLTVHSQGAEVGAIDAKTRLQNAQTKQEFNALLKQEYKEELGSNKDVPFSRMRILIIVLLMLFVIGFVAYCCFFY